MLVWKLNSAPGVLKKGGGRRKTKESQCKIIVNNPTKLCSVTHGKIHLASTDLGNHDNSPSLKSFWSFQSLTSLLGALKCTVVQQPAVRGCLRWILYYLSLHMWASTLGAPAKRQQAAGQPLYLKSKHWIPFPDSLSWAWPSLSFRPLSVFTQLSLLELNRPNFLFRFCSPCGEIADCLLPLNRGA